MQLSEFPVLIWGAGDEALPNARSMESGKKVPNIFFDIHIFIATCPSKDVIHLKYNMPAHLVYECSEQERQFRIIFISILPTPGLPVKKLPGSLNPYPHFRKLCGNQLVTDDWFSPLNPHPGMFHASFIAGS
jgi:hypothetical protein